jgi:tetratricopeptide (TPR) repeat protein
LREFEKKINFISSFKKETPLFLRTAQNFIVKNDYQSAIVVLKKGLKIFPEHPVAHILLGKVFIFNHNYERADSSFKIAADLLKSKRTYEYYSNEIHRVNRFTVNRESFSKNNSSSMDLIGNSGSEDHKKQSEEIKRVEDQLEQLAEVLSSAKIQRIKENGMQKSDIFYRIPERSKIISETLAKIYLSQGERSEAIKVYEKLIKKNPLKEGYYLEKIRQIQSS